LRVQFCHQGLLPPLPPLPPPQVRKKTTAKGGTPQAKIIIEDSSPRSTSIITTEFWEENVRFFYCLSIPFSHTHTHTHTYTLQLQQVLPSFVFSSSLLFLFTLSLLCLPQTPSLFLLPRCSSSSSSPASPFPVS